MSVKRRLNTRQLQLGLNTIVVPFTGVTMLDAYADNYGGVHIVYSEPAEAANVGPVPDKGAYRARNIFLASSTDVVVDAGRYIHVRTLFTESGLRHVFEVVGP